MDHTAATQSAAGAARIRVRANGEPRDRLIRWQRNSDLDVLCSALAVDLGRPVEGLWRDGLVIESPQVLRSGDLIDLDPRDVVGTPPDGSDGAGAVVGVDVVRGPWAGRCFDLAPGTVDIGTLCGGSPLVATVGADGSIRHTDGAVISEHFAPGPGIEARWAPIHASTQTRKWPESGSPWAILRQPSWRPPPGGGRVGPLKLPLVPTAPAPVPAAAITVPLVGGLIAAIAFGRPEFLLVTSIGPVAVLATWLSAGRRHRRRRRAVLVAIDDLVVAARADIAEQLESERRGLEHRWPDLGLLARRVRDRSPALWDLDAAEGLRVRLGRGRGPSTLSVEVVGDRSTPHVAGSDTDPLERRLDLAVSELTATAAVIENAPIGIDLHESVAVVGPGSDALVATMLMQLACRYSPAELSIMVRTVTSVPIHPGRPGGADLGWTVWLPHRGAVAPTRIVVSDDTSDPRWLAAVEGPLIWFSTHGTPPRRCQTVVEVVGDRAHIRSSRPEILVPADEIALEVASTATIEQVARWMAPLVDAAADPGAGAPVMGALELLGTVVADRTDPLDPGDIGRRWAGSIGLRSLVGSSTTAAGARMPFELDLEADGPHALVAGTTGSGKSELLRAWLIGLCLANPPQRCTFLTVDYKGGSGLAELSRLPHCVGAITNLDPGRADRVLVSLAAELRRRMALMAGRATDLAGLRAIDPDGAPASLVVVIDEFAALVDEVPGFVPAVVDLAQRGRSLGMHLVLATQRPTGVVSDAILANTNLRIALRTADPGESMAIVSSPAAASSSGPGVAWVKIGAAPARQVEVAPVSVGADQTSVTCVPLAPWLDAVDRADRDPEPSRPAAGSSILDRAIEAIGEAWRHADRPAPPSPWQEDLPGVVEAEALESAVSAYRATPDGACRPDQLVVRVGLVDDPADQFQGPCDLGIDDGVLVCGSPRSGVSSALRAIALSAARRRSPEELRLHLVDWAGGSVASLSGLPHVSSSATAGELEPVCRMLQLLDGQLAAVLAGRSGHPNGLGGPEPLDLVVLDGANALLEQLGAYDYGEWSAMLTRLARDGSRGGVVLVLGVNGRLDLPSALASALRTRITLRGAEGAGSLGPRDVERLLGAHVPPGRAVVGARAVQIAWSDPVRAVPQISLQWSGHLAAPLPQLPRWWAIESSGAPSSSPDGDGGVVGGEAGVRAVIAVHDLAGGVAVVDLDEGHLTIIGPRSSGRTNAAAVVAAQMVGRRPLVLVAGAGQRLRSETWWNTVLEPGTSLEPDGPGEAPTQESASGIVEGSVLVVDLTGAELADHNGWLDALAGLAARRSVRLVAVADPHSWSRGFGDWWSHLRRSPQALVLCPSNAAEVETLTGARLRLRPGQDFPPGRGVLVNRGAAGLVQVPLLD